MTTNDPITHSVLVDAAGVLRTDISCVDYSGLIAIRTNPIQITTRVGRKPSLIMDITYSVNDYNMRKKADTLQYTKNKLPLTKKQQYGRLSDNGSYFYSNQELIQKKQSELDCPSLDLIVRPPTNSGIHDYKFPGYYLNNSIPLRLVNNNLNS
uniref:Uncharacterized protein n=1 Tax=viral metagenome TaxID=1070528 RepID=A0A6C0ETG7_9ZZZZ